MNPQQLGLGLVLSILIGGLAYWRRSLNVSGWIGAVCVGTLTFGFGGWAWGLTLITFFVTSSLLSHYKERVKEQRAAEKFSKGGRRDFWQTVANGGIGAVLALLYVVAGQPDLILGLFIGVMATVNADTWATELGVLSPHRPRLITNGQSVEPGTSGGVTAVGTSAAALGGLVVGVALWIFAQIENQLGAANPAAHWAVIPAALIGGLAGALIDSWMGATVQAIYAYPDGRETERVVGKDGTPNRFVRGWQWLNNDLVNLLSSVLGGVIGAGVFVALR